MIVFQVRTDNGSRRIVVDPDSDLGALTPDEVKMMAEYVRRSGFTPERAWAGAHLLILLARQVPDIAADDLLEAVVDAA